MDPGGAPRIEANRMRVRGRCRGLSVDDDPYPDGDVRGACDGATERHPEKGGPGHPDNERRPGEPALPDLGPCSGGQLVVLTATGCDCAGADLRLATRTRRLA